MIASEAVTLPIYYTVYGTGRRVKAQNWLGKGEEKTKQQIIAAIRCYYFSDFFSSSTPISLLFQERSEKTGDKKNKIFLRWIGC